MGQQRVIRHYVAIQQLPWIREINHLLRWPSGGLIDILPLHWPVSAIG